MLKIHVLLFSILSNLCLLYANSSHRQLNEVSASVVPKISAVMLTTTKDGAVFERGVRSALKHLVDVDKFYVITPSKHELSLKFKSLGERVIFVDEQSFNFTGALVADTMVQSVRDRGTYPLGNGNSPFERTLWGKLPWYLQQLLKIYAGKYLNLKDYVLLDGDCVWFRDTKFIAEKQTSSIPPFRYNYATSTQIHGAYLASSKRISGVDIINAKKGKFRSGVVHHMVLVKEVLDDLFKTVETLHGLPMWQVMLNQSALEMTCMAPNTKVCAEGSALSEYELYFNFARVKYPETVELRPLLWANGPRPGLLYWPDPTDAPVVPLLSTDTAKYKWRDHKPSEVMDVFERQMEADRLAGFDYVGYHGYAKRRYFELHQEDIQQVCKGIPEPFNTSCSYRGLDQIELRPDRTPQSWFSGCGCFMAKAA